MLLHTGDAGAAANVADSLPGVLTHEAATDRVRFLLATSFADSPAGSFRLARFELTAETASRARAVKY